MANYSNTGPLQKHQAVTETANRYSNIKPSQKHPPVTKTQSRCDIRTVTETQRRFRNIDVSQQEEDLQISAYVRARSPRDHIHVQLHGLLASKVHTCKHN